jgi:calcineurin-like phosphoesterase family protein
MREILVANWNSCVKPGDMVVHGGDFAFANKNRVEELIERLNGQIHLTYGNHDKGAVRQTRKFAWSGDYNYKGYKVPWNGEIQRIYVFHYACRVWDKSHHGAWMLYGHSHFTLPTDWKVKSFDMGIDAHAHRLAEAAGRAVRPEDYRPASIAEVAAEMEKHGRESVDHHGRGTMALPDGWTEKGVLELIERFGHERRTGTDTEEAGNAT